MKLFRGVVLIIFLLSTATAQDFKTVQDGVEYTQFTRQVKINDKETAPVVVNALRLDLKKTRLDVVHAMDAAIGTEKTSSIATRYNAVAAINAGFFRLDTSIFKGDASGVLQIDGKLLSETYGNRIALLISNDLRNPANKTEISFEHLKTGSNAVVGKQSFDILGINRQRNNVDVVLYTPEFHRTTLTNSDGIEVVIQNGRVSQIFEGKGSNEIPQNGFVISITGKKREDVFQTFKIGAKVTINRGNYEAKFENSELIPFSFAEDIIGGVPQLIKNGKIEITWEQEKSSKSFVETRHPRTAVAKLKDGKALFVTVDGRQPGVSVGMNLQELAELLLEMGATDAMNLDGGGSTTMFLDGKVVNKPSDKEGERAVSDAILVTLRKTK